MCLKVLIADSSAIVRKNIMKMLNNDEYLNLLEAKDVKSTISALRKKSPDIVLLDFMMHDGQNCSVMKFLHSSETRPVVLAFTDLTSMKRLSKCSDCKADYFFDKTEDVRAAVRTIKKIAEKNNSGKISLNSRRCTSYAGNYTSD